MLSKIEYWQKEGFFNPLDFAFCATLARLDSSANPSVLFSAALTSLALSRGNVALDLEKTKANPERLFSEKPKIDLEILAAIQNLNAQDFENQNAVFDLKNENKTSPKPLVFDGKRLYLWRYFVAEREIENNLLKRLETPPKQVDAEILDILFPDESDKKSDQKTACAKAFSQNFCVISGGPGTGKTTTVTKLLALIFKANPETKIALAAPTGKAAQRLKESIDGALQKLPAEFADFKTQKFEPVTIHRLLENKGDFFAFNESRPLPCDVLILDEASMIDLLLMRAVLKALPLSAKLVLLGDDKQLASVDAGCLLNEICNAENATICHAIAPLKTSYRFDDNSGIGQFAAAVLNQKSKNDIAAIFENFKNHDLELITEESEFQKVVGDFYEKNQIARGENLNDYAQKLLARNAQFQVLCALRKGEFGVEGLNAKIEEISKKFGVDRGKSEFFEQCPVMMTENIAHLGLNNGDLGVCVFDEENRARFFFNQGDSVRRFSPERLKNRAEKMFALTIHKSQGSEFRHVLLVLPPHLQPILTRELLYTGITRAREKLTIYIPQAAQPFDLIYKISTRPFWRQGGLFS